MHISMKATTPDNIQFTLSATMSLREWREIKKEMENSHRSPIYEFKQKISDAIKQAEKEYEVKNIEQQGD